MFQILYENATELERTIVSVLMGFTWAMGMIALGKYIVTSG